MDDHRYVNQQFLRCGYTTGTCAAAAAKAAALFMLRGTAPAQVQVTLPQGQTLTLAIAAAWQAPAAHPAGVLLHCCSVCKDAGDDPDITHGIMVQAWVRQAVAGIAIEGGPGIGKVTKPGLDQPVGAAAINSGPRKMIAAALHDAGQSCGYTGGFAVVIALPGGQDLARRTFNPRLGIEGGLSILGTSGIVEPMSEPAMVETFRRELAIRQAQGQKQLVLVIGNYGETFAREKLRLPEEALVKCSNFIGEALAAAAEMNFSRVLLIGHIGKLVKLGIGMMNTHSRHGDGRMETLLTCALAAGADLPLLRAIAPCATTEAALLLLWQAECLDATMAILGGRISDHLSRHFPAERDLGFICFSQEPALSGILVQSPNAQALLEHFCPGRTDN